MYAFVTYNTVIFIYSVYVSAAVNKERAAAGRVSGGNMLNWLMVKLSRFQMV